MSLYDTVLCVISQWIHIPNVCTAARLKKLIVQPFFLLTTYWHRFFQLTNSIIFCRSCSNLVDTNMYIISWRSWTLAFEYVTITLTLNISSERLVCTYRPSVSIFVDKQRRRCQPCFTTHDNRIRSIVCNWYIEICPCCLTIYNKCNVFQYWTHTSNVTVLSIILL